MTPEQELKQFYFYGYEGFYIKFKRFPSEAMWKLWSLERI